MSQVPRNRNPRWLNQPRRIFPLGLVNIEWVNVDCNENPIGVFQKKKLRGLSPLSPCLHIHVSVIDSYIPRIGPHIFMHQNRQTDCGNRYEYIAHRHMNVEIRTEARNSFSGNICFKFSVVFAMQCSIGQNFNFLIIWERSSRPHIQWAHKV